jgi:hypothetical protein
MEIVIEQNTAEKDRFHPGLTCAAIYEIKDKKQKKRTTTDNENALPLALEALALLKSNIKAYEVDDINPIIRALGRRRLVSPIFELLDCMRDAGTYCTNTYRWYKLSCIPDYVLFYLLFLSYALYILVTLHLLVSSPLLSRPHLY